jgi:hypothetical protein
MREPAEKRRIQRIRPSEPIAATVAGVAVKIVDLSTVGARVEHEFPLSTGGMVRLQFTYSGETFDLSCQVVRCRLQRSVALRDGGIVYNSGLRFADAEERSRALVRELVASLVLDRLEKSRQAGEPAK